MDGALEAIYHADGRVKFEGSNSERQYIIFDNLQNTRVLFKDNGSGVASVIEDYSYYPMGSLQKDVSDLQQSYTYGGKEL